MKPGGQVLHRRRSAAAVLLRLPGMASSIQCPYRALYDIDKAPVAPYMDMYGSLATHGSSRVLTGPHGPHGSSRVLTGSSMAKSAKFGQIWLNLAKFRQI